MPGPARSSHTVSVNAALDEWSPHPADQSEIGERLAPRMTKSLAPVLRGRLGICGSSRSLTEDVIQNILMNFDRQIRKLGLVSAEPGRSGDRCGDTSINLNDRK
jgi:hypothetical protein